MSGKNASPVENTTLKSVKTDTVIKQEFITDPDRHALDLIKLKRSLAAASVREVELTYNNLVLQLTLKYSLQEKDAITEQGEILRSTQGA